MQVNLVRSGGLAGLKMASTVDTADLPSDQQGLVTKLISEDLRSDGASRPGRSDQFSYQLEILDGDRTVRRQWSESEVPESVRPLLSALTSQAKPTR